MNLPSRGRFAFASKRSLAGLRFACDVWARRGLRHPPGAHAAAVCASRRLHCAARAGVAPRNSLHSLRSFRSDNRGESDHEARWRAPTPALRCSPPQKSPLAGAARRVATLVVFVAPHATTGSARQAVPGGRDFWGAEERRALGRARSAHRLLTRRDCSSAANAVSVASFATGHEPEYRRGVGAKRRPPQHERSSGTACGAALNSPEKSSCERAPAQSRKRPLDQVCFVRRGSHVARWSA
jgi:hypothetical protein